MSGRQSFGRFGSGSPAAARNARPRPFTEKIRLILYAPEVISICRMSFHRAVTGDFGPFGTSRQK